MTRYKKKRFISRKPENQVFAPLGNSFKEELVLSLEGFEAIRLSDYENLNQETASKIMGVSRQTYGRILREARQIIAEALVVGKKINISGGHYQLRSEKGNRRRFRGGQSRNPDFE
ncbi:MAG: DUF134 domain-containing protein [Desulforegulaceae bacterium]|nr:DUF134 domain-containing protein [Desulforegulaceae bacterium]